MYEDNDMAYVDSRLRDTMIDHDGALYLYAGIIDNKVQLVHVKSCNAISLLPSELKINPVKLGYVPRTNGLYLARIPKRRDWRQGIRKNNLAAYQGGMRCNAVDITHKVRDIYHRTYEKKEVVIDRGTGTLSPDFALFRGSLFYKKFVVGILDEKGIKLFANFKWLQEIFDEQVG